LPCENTTVLTVRLKKHPLAAVTDVWQLKPPLPNIDLLDWRAFDRAIQAGYDYARVALDELPAIPRLIPAALTAVRTNSAVIELERKIAATIAAR